MGKNILFVDDEKQILRALRRLFHRTEHNIMLANSGEEALKILRENPVDMVISDMRMPIMDGHELLSRVKESYPETIRIALSGYTDKVTVLSALDKNLAKIYLFKPWNNEKILSVIKGLFEFEEQLKDRNLLDIINNLENLPTLPRLYTDINRMVEKEEPISKIADCINNDQAIASRILRIANSAYFGKKTGDIKDAIVFIGLSNVKNIILSNSIFGATSASKDLMEAEFEHSSITNRILNDLYIKLLNKKLPNIAKSAGLLHNIGKSVIMNNFRELDYRKEHKDLVAEELLVVGANHQSIGGYILNWWELPFPIIESAMYHHNPCSDEIVNRELVISVHIAQHLARKVLGMEPEDDLSLEALQELQISYEDIEKLLNSYLEQK